MSRYPRIMLLVAWLASLVGCQVPPAPVSGQSGPPANAVRSKQKEDEYDGWLFKKVTGQGAPQEQAAAAPQNRPGYAPGNPSGVVPTSATAPLAAPGGYAPGGYPAAEVPPGLSPGGAPAAYPPPAAPLAASPPPVAPPVAPAAGVSVPDGPKKEEKKKGFDIADLAPENIYKNAKSAVGLGPDEKFARQNLKGGEALFREKKYADAVAKFKTAADRWPDSALEEDAQFLLAESCFFSDQYSKAHDTFTELLKKHDNTRYLDTVMAREFAIGHYWEQMYRKSPSWPITPNLTDKSRPMFDTFGNAIKAYETIRMHDPTGPLADDAVMATANAYFVKGEFENAAFHYDLLRKEYPSSEFQQQAHLLGLQAKMRVYQGKDYDGVPLGDADEIAKQLKTQFGSKLGPELERVNETARKIQEMKAERQWSVGQYYETKKAYRAARITYDGLVKEYPATRHAEMARARLAEIRDKPDLPPNHFKWLTDIFPSELK
jgi:outer membrane protein assembly factor BamD (BamD/ComL family)